MPRGSTAPQGAPRLAPTGETPYRPPTAGAGPTTLHTNAVAIVEHPVSPSPRGRALPDPTAREGESAIPWWCLRAGHGAAWDRRGGRYTSRGAAAPQGDGRGTPRPCTGWTSIPSRAHARHGSAVRRPPCRGRALPDPPARRAGNGRAAWPDAHSAERHGREDDCRPGRRAGGVVRRRSASPWHRLRGPSPVARYLPRFGAADSLCRAQALPNPPAREGWA
jgi:hypothetical protein